MLLSSASLTSIESRAPPSSRPKNNYHRRRVFLKNRNKPPWPNRRQESKRCFKWMLKE